MDKKDKPLLSILIFPCVILMITSGCEWENVSRSRTSEVSEEIGYDEETEIPTHSPTTQINDGGLISLDPCAPPCFFGIIPGETDYGDALDLMDEAGVSPDSSYGFQQREGSTVIESIAFEPSVPITLTAVQEIHGPPDYVLIFALGGNEPVLFAWVYYDAFNGILELPPQEEIGHLLEETQLGGSNYQIEPSLQILAVHYMEPAEYEIYIAENPHPWAGYISYPENQIE